MNKERLKWLISGIDFERLNDWEEDFVGKLEDRFDRRGFLTDREEEILEEIYRKKGR